MINYINNIYHTILTMNVDELIHKLKITDEENETFYAYDEPRIEEANP